MYDQTTRAIRVTVTPAFLDEQSTPEENYFVWAYTIVIENLGQEVVRLRTRYWRITDALGRSQEVRGEGVVGEQPLLKPGESFEYTSGAPLPTPSGMMVGAYQMETVGGEMFNVDVPVFALESPYEKKRLH
ncbi:ApaG protein [Rhodoligotrophos appendicifer]|uniref:Co2+/Mg2+ efflux protein ApaG n=1 Tax=Rhodoligotrophos appendicifer TaxID=987056 RepID=UPI00117CC413|nr:Co2+/Mg2+ efflux protein ApaG [Rhodoligotrophos appendicifer]